MRAAISRYASYGPVCRIPPAAALWPRAWRATGLALLLAVFPAAAEPVSPQRVVSINLCADELLLALAEPQQIAALSPYSVDPKLSFMAPQAVRFRHDASEAETVIGLNPDLVLAGRFTKRATRDMLTRLGYRVVLLDSARSIDASLAQIGEIAALLGQPERGAALASRIEAARRRAASTASPARPSAVVYQRRGYVTGAETMTAELLAIAGFRNDAAALTGGSGGFVSLERLVAKRPDYLVVAAPAVSPEDQGAALLAHPALAELYPPERRIVLPERLTVCGGPSLPAALDWLASEARRVAGST